jgi:hypothetical protein
VSNKEDLFPTDIIVKCATDFYNDTEIKFAKHLAFDHVSSDGFTPVVRKMKKKKFYWKEQPQHKSCK